MSKIDEIKSENLRSKAVTIFNDFRLKTVFWKTKKSENCKVLQLLKGVTT